MKNIEFLSTTELERLEREFRTPKTLTESIMRRGIVAELETRWGGMKSAATQREEELEDEISEAREEIRELENKLGELENKLDDAPDPDRVIDLEKRVAAAITPKPEEQSAA